jgi:4'-phosphopantetheinyl transferase
MRRTELAAPAPFRLWMLALDTWPAPASVEKLSVAERERAQRYRFDHLRRRYLASHVALRESLAGFCGEAEATQQFVEGPFGKPALVSERCAFNMSHSHDVAVIAVAPQGNIGVDVEVLRPVEDALAIAQRNFTPTEHQHLLAAPADERDLVFMRLWTRKEACLKAVGSGFSIAPGCFEAGAETAARQLRMPTPAGTVDLHVVSLPETEGCAIALAWLIPLGD